MTLVFAATCALIAAATAFAQPEGAVVRAIEVQGDTDVTAERAADMMRLNVGDIVTESALDDALRRLWDLPDIRPPRIETEPYEDGVKLVAHLYHLPITARIEFTGDLPVKIESMRAALDVLEGRRAAMQDFIRDSVKLEEFLRSKGYHLASVDVDAEEKEDGWRVVYNVVSGPRLSVGMVRFEGNESIPEAELRRQVGVRPTGLLRKAEFEPIAFRDALSRVAEYYRDRGWLDVSVGHRFHIDEAQEWLYPVVMIEEGPLYMVEHVVVSGATLFTEMEILEEFELEAGAAFSQIAFASDLDKLRNMYWELGRIRVEISTSVYYDDVEPRVSLEIEVLDEGPGVFVERVDIRGNEITKDNVIRRYLTLHPGDPINPEALEESRRKLANSGIFQPESVRVFFEEGSDSDKVNVIAEVDDSFKGRMSLGASWSTNVGVAGLFELVHYNFDITDVPEDFGDLTRGTAFAGGGQQFTLRLSPGQYYHDYRLSWHDPMIADSEYSFGFDLYFDRWRYRDYDQSRGGIEFALGRTFLDEKLSVTLRPGYENLNISNISSNAAQDVFDAEGSHGRHVMGIDFAYDMRDNRFSPSEGYYAALGVTNVGYILGGDVDVFKEELQFDWYTTVVDSDKWGKHVLHLGAQAGFMQGSDIPIFERYWAGGQGSIRGFEFRRIGPVDSVQGRHVGGEAKLLGTAEYKFPLYGDTLSGVLFTDVGSLENSAGSLLSNMRASVGFGFRVYPVGPMMPIVLDFGFPVMKESTDKTEVFSFSIGAGFMF